MGYRLTQSRTLRDVHIGKHSNHNVKSNIKSSIRVLFTSFKPNTPSIPCHIIMNITCGCSLTSYWKDECVYTSNGTEQSDCLIKLSVDFQHVLFKFIKVQTTTDRSCLVVSEQEHMWVKSGTTLSVTLLHNNSSKIKLRLLDHLSKFTYPPACSLPKHPHTDY